MDRVRCMVFLLALACGSVPAPVPQLVAPEWQDGETATYEVVRNDSVQFRRTLRLEFDEESAVPLVIITSVVVPESAPVFFRDSSVAALRRFSLKPAWTFRAISTDVSASEVETRYDDGMATVRKETIEGGEDRDLKLPVDCYSAEALAVTLRGLPLEPGRSYRAHVLIPLEFRVEPVDIHVLGTRRITTAIGDIVCREVEVVESRRRLRLAYELAQPRRLVSVRDAGNATETVLVDYVPGGVDEDSVELP